MGDCLGLDGVKELQKEAELSVVLWGCLDISSPSALQTQNGHPKMHELRGDTQLAILFPSCYKI